MTIPIRKFENLLFHGIGILLAIVILSFCFTTYNPILIKEILFQTGTLFIILFWLIFGSLPNYKRPQNFLILLYAFYLSLNFIFLKGNFYSFCRWLLLLGVMIVFSNLNAVSIKKIFFPYILTVSIFVSLYGLLQKVGLDSLIWRNWHGTGIVFSTLGNPSSLAIVIVLIFPVFYSKMFMTRKLSSLFIYFLLTFLLLLNEIFTNSFCENIAFLVMLIFYYFHMRKKIHLLTTKSKYLLFLISILLFSGIMVFKIASLINNKGFFEKEILYRKHAWLSTVRLIKNNALFGCGIGNFGKTFPKYRNLNFLKIIDNSKQVYTDYSENTYLDIISEQGIIGFLFFSILLIAAILPRRIENFLSSEDINERDIYFYSIISGINAFLIGECFGSTLNRIQFIPSTLLFFIYLGTMYSSGLREGGNNNSESKEEVISKSNQKLFIIAFISVIVFIKFSILQFRRYLSEKYLKKAIYFSMVAKWKKASSLYEKSLNYDSSNIISLYFLGHTYADAGFYDDAIKVYKRVKKIFPDYPKLNFNLGYMYKKKYEYLLNLRELNKARKLYNLAIKELKQAIKKNPYQLNSYIVLSDCYKLAGERSKSQEILLEGLKYLPTNEKLLSRLKIERLR